MVGSTRPQQALAGAVVMRKLQWALLAVGVMLSAGCGYTTKSSLDEQYQTIFVSAFQNASRQYDFQAPLTNAITRKFINDSRLRVVGRDEADLILEGVIRDYRLKEITTDKDDETTQFLCVVLASARLTERATGKIVCQSE